MRSDWVPERTRGRIANPLFAGSNPAPVYMGNLFDRDWYSLWRACLVLDKSSKYAAVHKAISMATCDTANDFDNLYRDMFRREVTLKQMESKEELKKHLLHLVEQIKD